jgi:hypothetical protein
MSLCVDVYLAPAASGDMQLLEPVRPGGDLAGHEVCRHDLWGSPVVIGLGAVVLPALRDGDIYAEGPQMLADLDRDCRLILDHIDAVAAGTPFDEEYIRYRTGNIRAAIERARQLGGHVVVW